MTAAQRLRLVLALGVVNLVLATVAFGFGIAESISTPGVASGPTPGTAVVVPTPTASTTPGGGPGPRPTVVPPATTAPGGPGPSIAPGPEPSAVPSAQPSAEPSSIPSAAPSSVPSAEPTAAPATASAPPRVRVAVVGRPGSATPKPSPSDGSGTPDKPDAPDGHAAPVGCRASARGIEASDGKACPTKDRAHPGKPDKPRKSHHDNGHHHGRNAHRDNDRGGHQPATVEERRGPRSRHRLRRGRRPR